MKRRTDPTLDALRRANPAPEASTTGWHASAEGMQVAERALAGAPERQETGTSPGRSRRTRILVAVVASVAALALGAKLGDSTPRETITPNLASCFLVLDPNTSRDVVPLKHRTPVETCAAVLKRRYNLTPAHLAACVFGEGGTAVFPYEDPRTAAQACESVGLDPLKTDP